MKKSLKRLLVSGAALLLAAPIAASTAHSVLAADGDLASGDSALSGYPFAETNGNSGWVSVSGTPAIGNSYVGVGFVAGPLTLNQVPNFDFGVHNIGSSQTYDLQKITGDNAKFLPKPLADTHAPGDTAQGGTRSLVVTDTRTDKANVTGYTVALRFTNLNKVVTDSKTGQPVLDKNGKIQFEGAVDGDGKPIAGQYVNINDATLTLNKPKTIAAGNTWNTFLNSAADGTFFDGGPAVYPGYYSANADAFNGGTAISTSDARFADTDAPVAAEQAIGQKDDGAVNIMTAAAAVQGADAKNGQGFGTWVYDFSNPKAASLTMPTQKAGLWMANLYWVLTADPAAAAPKDDAITGLQN